MIEYIQVEPNQPKRAMSVRMNAEGKNEYCFGLNVWRKSRKRAWLDFQEKQAEREFVKAFSENKWGELA